MSKLLDALERANRSSSAPLGFGAAAQAVKGRSLVLVGMLPKGAKKEAGLLPRFGAEAALIEGLETVERLEELTATLDKTPWGVQLVEIKKEEYAHWQERGADFFVFPPEKAYLDSMEDEKAGFFLQIKPDLDDRYLRVIEDLPVDGVIVGPGPVDSPLTVQHLMYIGALRTMFEKYLLVEIPANLTRRELEALCHMGVDGVLVNMARASTGSMKTLTAGLEEARRPRVGKQGRTAAVLPRGIYGAPSSASQEEEDEEES